MIRKLTLPQTDLFAARQALAQGRPSFYLELEGKAYLFSQPRELLAIREGVLYLENEQGIRALPGNPLLALRRHLESQAPTALDLPVFSHGAVGYLGYDVVQYLEKIAFRGEPAGEDEACFLLFREVAIASGTEIFLVAHEGGEAALDRMESALRRPHAATKREAPSLNKNLRATPDDESFAQAVREVKKHIRQGDIFQCVLSQRQEAELAEEPSAIFERLRAREAAPYRYFFEAPRQTLLGASPERLVKVLDGVVETCPIAGTRPRGADAAEDERLARQLRRSPKERAEHLMLVDLSRNDLGRVCGAGTIQVSQFRKLQRFAHVMHLVSKVTGRLREGESALGALFAAFPAGTLTGAPKIRAMQILAELEPRRRGAYGGAVVLYDFRGQLESCITIRSLVAREGRAAVQAGAGLVADSRTDRELAEIQHKSRAVRRALIAGAL